jgi:hypothetical protein
MLGFVYIWFMLGTGETDPVKYLEERKEGK